MGENTTLIEVLQQAIQREQERIERAQIEIMKLRQELLDLGVKPPLED